MAINQHASSLIHFVINLIRKKYCYWKSESISKIYSKCPKILFTIIRFYSLLASIVDPEQTASSSLRRVYTVCNVFIRFYSLLASLVDPKQTASSSLRRVYTVCNIFIRFYSLLASIVDPEQTASSSLIYTVCNVFITFYSLWPLLDFRVRN